MYRSSLLLLAAFAVFVGSNAGPTRLHAPQLDGRIIGGQDVDINGYPYQVSVRIMDEHHCAGSIIGEKLVLTAAHCINNGDFGARDYSIQYGLTRIGRTGNLINATELIVNDKYSDFTSDYDIGLIILATAIPLGPGAQIISLATNIPAAGTNAVVTGWGTPDQLQIQSLQSVTLQIISNEACQKQYLSQEMTITDRMLCAGVPTGGKDSCEGDSGGPLVANGKVVGIVSWGHGCGEVGFYGVYSNVANLRDWISENSP